MSLLDIFSLSKLNKSIWKIENNILYIKKVYWSPIMMVHSDGSLLISFSRNFSKEVIKLIRLINDYEFYLISPLFFSKQSIKNLDETVFHTENLSNYLANFCCLEYYTKFSKIEFNLSVNIVKYCDKYDCFNMINPIWKDLSKTINGNTYDWFSRRYEDNFPDEIKERYSRLMREITICQVLNYS